MLRFLSCFLLGILMVPSLSWGTTLLICGVAHNCSRAIPTLIRNAEALGQRFEDYRVIVYENNSHDDTPQQLTAWACENDRVTAICDYLTHEQLCAACQAVDENGHPNRVERISRARNKVLEEANSGRYPHFDQVVVVDCDFCCDWPIDELCRVSQMDTWDCVTSYGIDYRGIYYDIFALRDYYLPLGPEFFGDDWWALRCTYVPMLRREDPWLPVTSAFGGLAIYRAECLLPFRYSALVTDTLKAEARQILSQELRLRRALLRCRGANAPLLTNHSNWQGAPIVCEHVALHAEMRKHGYRRVFINPAMRLTYPGPS